MIARQILKCWPALSVTTHRSSLSRKDLAPSCALLFVIGKGKKRKLCFANLPTGRLEVTPFVVLFSLTKNYKHRPKYKKLLEHPFIKKYDALPIDVSVWYQTAIRQIESSQLVRQSPQRTSQRMCTPPSPSLRRVTSEPPPIPPRTPESQRKPLLVRLASEPVVDGLDFQTVNGRVTVVGTKQSQQQQQQQQFQFDPKPPAGKPSPPVSGPVGPGGFRFNLPLRPPALPPRPPPTGGNPQQQSTQLQTSPSEETQPSLGMRGFNPSRVTNPPTDLPGLPPRPPPAVAESAADRNSSSVTRLAQMFGTQLSPARYNKRIEHVD